MELFIFYGSIYLSVACATLLLTAIVRAYTSRSVKLRDWVGSIIWPVTIGSLLGSFVRSLKKGD